jgi:hypothetical protein
VFITVNNVTTRNVIVTTPHQRDLNEVLNALHGDAIPSITRLTSIENSTHNIKDHPLSNLGNLIGDLRAQRGRLSNALYIAKCPLNSCRDPITTKRDDPTITLHNSEELIRAERYVDGAFNTC